MPINCFGVGLCMAYECYRRKQSDQLKTRSSAEQFLSRFQRDPMTMDYLRSIAAKCGYNRLNVLDNKAVIEVIAREVSTGWLRVCENTQETYAPTTAGGGEAASQPESKPFPLAERQKRVAEPQMAALEPATFPSNLNGATQAAALAAAAASGTPFCAH